MNHRLAQAQTAGDLAYPKRPLRPGERQQNVRNPVGGDRPTDGFTGNPLLRSAQRNNSTLALRRPFPGSILQQTTEQSNSFDNSDRLGYFAPVG